MQWTIKYSILLTEANIVSLILVGRRKTRMPRDYNQQTQSSEHRATGIFNNIYILKGVVQDHS